MVKKGNNDEASRKAHADKEAFMKQHAGLLESLLPGRTVNIAASKDGNQDNHFDIYYLLSCSCSSNGVSRVI